MTHFFVEFVRVDGTELLIQVLITGRDPGWTERRDFWKRVECEI